MTLTITYQHPTNNSANVVLANVNVNVGGVMGSESTVGIGADYQSVVTAIFRNGLWINSTTFVPAPMITLVSLSS